MRPAAKLTLSFVFFLAFALQAQNTTQDAVQAAQEEAVRRQEATISLHNLLKAAEAKQKENQLVDAAKLYQEAVSLIPMAQVGDAKVDAEKNEAVGGLDAMRIELATRAMKSGHLAEASDQIASALKFDPNNERLRTLKIEIDHQTVVQTGRVPSPEVLKTLPAIARTNVDVATLVQDGKILYEMGQYGAAEAKLKQALKLDPSNTAAPYYMDLLKEAEYLDASRVREYGTKSELLEVEKEWLLSTKNESLPVPNPMATTNLVYTSKGRQTILYKLQTITRSELDYGQGVPLLDAMMDLKKESKLRDLEQLGINFSYNPHGEMAQVPADAAATPQLQVAASDIIIKISPPLNNVTLLEALDAICKVADLQNPGPTPFNGLTYTIDDYAVWFYVKAPETVPLYTRTFHVDPNTFIQGLEGVQAQILSGTATSGSLGTSGNGGSSGFGGSSSQFGGSTSGQGGSTGGLAGQGGGSGVGAMGSVSYPIVSVAPGGVGGAGGAAGGGPGGGAPGTGGLNYITRLGDTGSNHTRVYQYFRNVGVNLATNEGKYIFFNDRSGDLLVRATASELEIIAQAVELLDKTPPQVTIDAKFASVTEEDIKGIGFNWTLGNTLLNGGAIGMQGGTAPSFQGAPTLANPTGMFPGAGGTATSPAPAAVAAASTDGSITSGTLRNSYGPQQTLIPTVATITGILTDPQFRMAINAIDQRSGADLLSAPRVTTLSGRQAHVAVQDILDIVTQYTPPINPTTISSGVAGTTTGGGTSSSGYSTTPFTSGPSLDVLPTVSADGYSIQMVMIPTYTEFVGYDNPGPFVPSFLTATGVSAAGNLPLPHYRVRQAVTTVNVWDGQTILLGGLIAENITKQKDKVPILGDLPLVGRLFRSESSDSTKANLMIFVTPTIIDPAGNRVHNEDDLPFARTSIPVQPANPKP